MKNFNEIATVAVLIIAWCVLASYASANNVTINESYAVVVTDTPVPVPTEIPHINQGDVVYVGDYVDISGVAPPYPQIAYWDGYDMYDSAPTYNITLPDTHAGYYRFYIDPAIFGNREGRWYKYAGVFEHQGNNMLFTVREHGTTNITTTYPNGTVFNKSYIQGNYTPALINPQIILPERHVADYLVARGAGLQIPCNDTMAVWVFDPHTNNILYVKNNSPFVAIDPASIQNLLPGNYKIITQEMGYNANQFDVIFDADHNAVKWFDPISFTIHTELMDNKEPSTALSDMTDIFSHTRDRYQISSLLVQDPAVTIERMDARDIGSASDYFMHDYMRGNVSLLDVRGYTNVPVGTKLTFVLDKTEQNSRTIKANTWDAVTTGSNGGNMRYYEAYVPLYWYTLSLGIHTVTAETDMGGETVADFPVEQMPPDSYQPDASVKYMGDSNPWKPNLTVPTPIVVTVPGPTVTVVVTVPPSNETVYEQQKKAAEDTRNETFVAIAEIIGGVVMVFVAIRFAYRVWKRKRWE